MSEADSVMLCMKDLENKVEFVFGIKTAAYDRLQRMTSWNWPAQERAGRRPALQYTGPGEDSITLDGTVYTEKAGLGQMDALRAMGDSGQPHIMVDQYGNVLGKWCVLSVKENQSSFFWDGAPRKQEFSVQLTAYGEDAE
jgi:phage protein U